MTTAQALAGPEYAPGVLKSAVGLEVLGVRGVEVLLAGEVADRGDRAVGVLRGVRAGDLDERALVRAAAVDDAVRAHEGNGQARLAELLEEQAATGGDDAAVVDAIRGAWP